MLLETTTDRLITRRCAMSVLGTAVASACFGQALVHASSEFSGASLFADVVAYDNLGVHRTATAGDSACSRWLQERLTCYGFDVELQSFRMPLFVSRVSQLDVQGHTIQTLPAWPPTPTPDVGVRGTLVAGGIGSLKGQIALVDYTYAAGGSWDLARFAGPADAALARNPAALVAVTHGPTGGFIELNQPTIRRSWPVPVVIAGGADGLSLASAAASGAFARLVSVGDFNPKGYATNVVARRKGSGRTIVISTPKSGWFHCAGERGSGIAISLALTSWLARTTTRDLVFVAHSGHEIGETGAMLFLKTLAPSPDRVAAWLHLGANVAAQDIMVRKNRLIGAGEPVTKRHLYVSPGFEIKAGRAFVGQGGYKSPTTLDAAQVPGELEKIRVAGYRPLFGLIGSGPLFHTMNDHAELATTPAILEPVAVGLRDLMRAVLVEEP